MTCWKTGWTKSAEEKNTLLNSLCGRCVYGDTCPYDNTYDCEYFEDMEPADDIDTFIEENRACFRRDWFRYTDDRE